MQDAEAPLESRLGNQVGFYASGWLGQRLAVWPSDRLVVVRQHRSTGNDAEENDSTDFPLLFKLSEALVAPEH